MLCAAILYPPFNYNYQFDIKVIILICFLCMKCYNIYNENHLMQSAIANGRSN